MRVRGTGEVRMETSLPGTKPQRELWAAPCEEEASLDFFLPLRLLERSAKDLALSWLPLEHRTGAA